MKKLPSLPLALAFLSTASTARSQHEPPATPPPPQPTLKAVHLDIKVGGDGVDSTSTVEFQVLFHNSTNAASYHLGNTHVGDNDDFRKDLTVSLTLKKSELNQSTFYLQINGHPSNDHDSFRGDASLSFDFSDGSTCAFQYGHFQIGTYHESNSTKRPIILVCP